MKAQARKLQQQGTHGDTVLAHINPMEARLLDLLADGKADGGGINPVTGLLSFGNTDGESGRSGGDANPGGVGGGPAGGQTGGGLGGNTDAGIGGRDGGYGDGGYAGSANQRAAEALGAYYQDNYIGGMLDSPYAPKDTWERVWQEMWNPSVPNDRWGKPTANQMGFLRDVVGLMTGGPMKAAMGLGAAMGRAQSPAEQAKSMAHNQALGAINSTGRDTDFGSDYPTPNTGAVPSLLGDFQPQTVSSGGTTDNASPATGSQGLLVIAPDEDRKKKAQQLASFIWSGEINPRNWL